MHTSMTFLSMLLALEYFINMDSGGREQRLFWKLVNGIIIILKTQMSINR